MSIVTEERITEATTEVTIEEPVEHTFDTDRLPVLDAELARLNKIADRLKVDRLSYTIVVRGTREKVLKDAYLSEMDRLAGKYWPTVTVDTVTVRIDGTTPKLPGGWKFLGSVEFLPDAEDGTKLSLVHGDDERLAAYRDAGPVCDHCGFRRNRKKVVVLEGETGALTVVGSTCLKDFLGYHGDPEKVLRFYEGLGDMMGDLDDDGPSDRFPRLPDLVPTEPFLALAAATVRVFGFTPKSAYDGTPTAERVADMLFPPRKDKHNREYLEEMEEKVEVTDDDAERATSIKGWINGAAADAPNNNYLNNLATVLAGSWVNLRHFGLGVSAVSAYDRALGITIKREVEAKVAAASEWVGTVGKREVFIGTVTAVIPYETMYGSGKVVKMLDADGNTLKSLTSGAWAYGLNVGDEVTVKATVKSHDTWREAKETNLTRAALVKAPPSGGS